MPQVGIDCKCYYSTGSWGSPVWVEFTLARDVSANLSKEKANAKARLTRFAKKLQGTKSVSLEITALQDSTDANYQHFRDGFINDVLQTIAFANGVISTTGTNYLKSDMYVFDFAPDQPIDEAETVKIGLELAFTVNDPVWVTA